MIREGDVVGWYWRRNVYVALVYHFDGIDDHYCRIVTEKCLLSGGPARDDATAYTFHTHLIPPDWVNHHGDVVLTQEHGDEVGKKIRAFLLTKKGKAMMKRTRNETKENSAPESGAGNPQKSDLPVRTTKGFTGNLTNAMTAYISDGGPRNWSLSTLKRENLVMYNVFVDRESHGYSFREIGERRNLNEANARKLYQRGRAAMREIAGSYPVVMRQERRQEEAA